MAGKKDKAIVANITDLTSAQAAKMVEEIAKAKDKYAPSSKGKIFKGNKEDVGSMLQGKKPKKITTSKK